MNENFLPRLKSIDNVLNIWHARGLSLKGKVTILKSLVLPKLLYPMSVLPIPSDIVKLVDDMVVDFMWSKRKPKIKRNVIIQDIEYGGIKAPSFAGMVEANRIMWIKRLMDPSTGKWKSVIEELIKPLSITHLIECNLNQEYINSIPLVFYKQVFDLWNVTKSCPENVIDFKNQIIWNNKNIVLSKHPKKIKEKTSLFWQNFYKAGIVKVMDLYDTNGCFYNFIQLYNKYNVKSNFLQLHSLHKAIPTEWKLCIENEQITPRNLSQVNDIHVNTIIKTDNKTLIISEASTKKIYQHIILRNYVRPTALNRWMEQLCLDDSDWPNIFIQPYFSTRETALQSFHYRIIHRIVPCKKWLFNQKVINSPNCLKCNQIDDIIHYFVECREVKDFWKRLESWWNRTTGFDIVCTTKHILFGVYYDNVYYSHVNYVLLLAKWFIYRQNIKDRPICFYNFLRELKEKLKLEEYICVKNNTSHHFHTKWNIVIDNL